MQADKERKLKECEVSEIIPPWKKYPTTMSFLEIWKRGNEDGYLLKWSDWFIKLSIEEKEEYILKYPEPKKWDEFYEKMKIAKK